MGSAAVLAQQRASDDQFGSNQQVAQVQFEISRRTVMGGGPGDGVGGEREEVQELVGGLAGFTGGRRAI
jgi:hypothetical protein